MQGLKQHWAVVFLLAFCTMAWAQSTGTIQGTVQDASGAVIPNAQVTIHSVGTGEDRVLQTDSAGLYVAASLNPGTYNVQAVAKGFQSIRATSIVLDIGASVTQNFSLKVSATSEVVEVTGALPVIDSTSVAVGSTITQQVVQEIPLNGRHFVDLTLLTVGTVTPPANGFLTAPLRGQGSFGFVSAGAREDEVNYMINGINMSDPVQNQITFQPTINTVSEFRVDNSTYSAEYGRNAGSIVNISTRAGTNVWHGELYDFLRNNDLDARNFTNTTYVVSGGVQTPNVMAPLKRNQFGGDGGGYIIKNKLFFYGSYEGLRQRQAVPLTATVFTPAQLATITDPVVAKIAALVPAANGPNGSLSSQAPANVDIDQGTGNLSYNFSDNHRINAYYALQRDVRGEPPSTDGNNIPGYGDIRQGKRQIFTLNDVKTFGSNWVNEARAGYNRIHITFDPDTSLNPANFGVNSGVNLPIGLPQIEITGGPSFGGNSGFPQGRGDTSAEVSDTVNWVHGKHNIKFGGDSRRIIEDSFSFTPGVMTFGSIASFLADSVTSFSTHSSNDSARVGVVSIGAFVTDTYKYSSRLTFDLGLRYEWYGTPVEDGGRLVVFNTAQDILQNVGQSGAPGIPYQQSNKNFQPRVGFAYDLFGHGNTILRGAYAIMTDQPITGIVTGLVSNPPFAVPLSTTAAGLTFENAYTLAKGSLAPSTINPNYKDAYVQSFNLNVQHKLASDLSVMAGFFGSKGTDLNIERNLNQFILGTSTRPYTALAASSPIDPGTTLGNITEEDSAGDSDYDALWTTLTKRFHSGLQMDSTFTWAKSIDDVSQNNHGVTVQDSTNIRGDRGLSDFNAATRFTLDGIYELPFKRNRVVSGWQLSTVIQLQSGNPINFHTAVTTYTGNGNLRPSVTGPVQTGFTPATNDSATAVTYIQNPGVFMVPGNAFGNLGRNAIIGPGFTNVDFAIVKNTKLTERLNFQIRFDAFDLLNVANLTNPISAIPSMTAAGTSFVPTASSTFGLITGGTRFTAGDFGSSRQIQLAMKLQF